MTAVEKDCENVRCVAHHGKRGARLFGIEIERCRHCGGALKVIASIEAPGV